MPRRTIAKPLSVLGFVLALLFGPHCTAEQMTTTSGAPDKTSPEAGVILSAASFELEWDTSGIDLDPQGGFSLQTNLGYEVHIERGFHVAHGVSLAKCPPSPASASWWSFSISSAYAHTTDADPSAIESLVISDLADPPGSVFLGASSFPPARYCKVFFLLARGMPGKTTQDGFDLSNRSLYFTGTYQKNGVSGPVLIDTWWPKGKLEDLENVVPAETFAAAREDGGTRFAFVTIHASLGQTFDDVDFAADSAAIITDRVIENITAGAEFNVDLRAP